MTRGAYRNCEGPGCAAVTKRGRLCDGCFTAKRIASVLHEGFGVVQGERVVVSGAAGAGKTRWVESQRQPGDLVWDLDVIAEAICQEPRMPRRDASIRVLYELRDAFITAAQKHQGRTFVIVADPNEAAVIAARLGATRRHMEAAKDRAV